MIIGTSNPKRILSNALLLCVLALSAYAEPRRPTDPTEIIERLPTGFQGPDGRRFLELRRATESDTINRDASLQFARLCIERGRALHDARYFGYAESVTEKVLAKRPRDVDFLVLRAILFQHNHNFQAAIADLDNALTVAPRNGQALVTRASIALVTGDFTKARADCSHLVSATSPLTAISCLALVGGATGGAHASYDALVSELGRTPDGTPNSERSWSVGALAELAERLGDDTTAEAWYKKGLELSPGDTFLLVSLADLLMRKERFEEVLPLLEDYTQDEGVLTRLTWAEKELHVKSSTNRLSTLLTLFRQEEERGETTHLQARALTLLQIVGDTAGALELAKQNFKMQKETSDLLIYAAAAHAARDTASLIELENWITANHWEDERLRPILNSSVQNVPKR